MIVLRLFISNDNDFTEKFDNFEAKSFAEKKVQFCVIFESDSFYIFGCFSETIWSISTYCISFERSDHKV